MVAKLSTEGADRLKAIDAELGSFGDGAAEGAADSRLVAEAVRIVDAVDPKVARRLLELVAGHARNNRELIRGTLAQVLTLS